MAAQESDGGADLAVDTAVQPVPRAPGWYTADLPDHWNFMMPSGGVLMTTALRAMARELADRELRPISATAVFCTPVPHGPLEIRVEVLRHGRAAAQIRAALSSTAKPGPGLEVSAVFARDRDGPEVDGARFPEVVAPGEAEPFIDDANPYKFARFFRQFDSRVALGGKWWRPDWEPGPTRFSRWFRYRCPQIDDRGVLDPFAIPPIADTMPASLWQQLGPGTGYRAPSLDLTVHFLRDSKSEWLLAHTYARCSRRGYATAEIEIWSDDGILIAYGTQTMILRRFRLPGEIRTKR